MRVVGFISVFGIGCWWIHFFSIMMVWIVFNLLSYRCICLLQPFEHLKWLKYITYTFKTPRNGKYGRHRRKPRTKWVSLLDFYEQIKMAYRRSVKQLCYGTLILVAELFFLSKNIIQTLQKPSLNEWKIDMNSNSCHNSFWL